MSEYSKYVIPAVIVLAVLTSFFIIKPFLISLITGAIIAYTFNPLYKLVNRRITSKSVAAFLVSVFILALVTIPAIVIVNTISREAYVLYVQGKELLLSGNLRTLCRTELCYSLENWFNIDQVQRSIQQSLEVGTEYLRKQATGFFLTLPRRTLEIFIVIVATFYLMRDGDKVREAVKKLLSTNHARQKFIFQRFNSVMHGVVYGSLLVAFVQGVAGTIGFAIFGVSSPLTWGVVMFFLALIPYIGTGLIWVPASLLLIINGLAIGPSILVWKGIGLFLYGALFISTIDNLIKPYVIGDRIRIHPLLVMIGIFGGLALMGIPGIIVGPVVLAMSLTLLNLYVDHEKG